MTAALIVFCIFNTQNVSLIWSPFHPPFELPMAFAGLILIGIAFLLGAIMVWLNGLPARMRARALARQLKVLEQELREVRQALKEQCALRPANMLSGPTCPPSPDLL